MAAREPAVLVAGGTGALGAAVLAELLDAPRCVLLPHIGSATTRARDAMAATVAANVLAVLRGAEPPNRVA